MNSYLQDYPSDMPRHKNMSQITPESIAEAVHAVQHMTLPQKEKLIDHIHAIQPHVLLTILALSQDAVPMPMLDSALHVLMVIHTAITKEGATDLPIASREDIRHAMERHCAMLSYLESEPDKEMWKLTATAYPEPALLAYLVEYLKDNGITADTDTQCLVVSILKVAVDLYVDAYHKRIAARDHRSRG